MPCSAKVRVETFLMSHLSFGRPCLWNSGYLVVLQSQLSDGLKTNYDFIDYLAFSHF